MLVRWFETPQRGLGSSGLGSTWRGFDNFFGGEFFSPRLWENATFEAPSRQTVERADDAVTLRVELAGFDKASVQVELDGDTLRVRAEHTDELPEGYAVRLRERSTPSFEKRYRLSDDIDRTQVEARYEDGVLTVRLPKKPEHAPRTIAVQ